MCQEWTDWLWGSMNDSLGPEPGDRGMLMILWRDGATGEGAITYVHFTELVFVLKDSLGSCSLSLIWKSPDMISSQDLWLVICDLSSSFK